MCLFLILILSILSICPPCRAEHKNCGTQKNENATSLNRLPRALRRPIGRRSAAVMLSEKKNTWQSEVRNGLRDVILRLSEVFSLVSTAMSQNNRRSLGLPVVAKKSVPTSPFDGPLTGLRKKYSNYLVFVEDPRLKTPFKVLPGNQISNVKRKCDLDNNTHLDKARRKRAFDLAFSPLFTYPSRIFAK